jgi:tetratricopeptide (TPR) repeat protein
LKTPSPILPSDRFRAMADRQARLRLDAFPGLDKALGVGPDRPPVARPPSEAKLEAAERRLLAMLAGAPDPEQALRAHLVGAPDDAVALRLLGQVLLGAGRVTEATRLLERSAEVAPGHRPARHALATAMLARGLANDALPHIDMLLGHAPQNADYLSLRATALAKTGDYAKAITIYEDLARRGRRPAQLWLGYAHALKYVGRRAESVRAYRSALELDPALGEAWWGLANMKNEFFSSADLAAMRGQLENPSLAAENRIRFHYALGRALELDGDYAGSFAQYQAGAALRHARGTHDPDAWSAYVTRVRDVFGAGLFAAHAGGGCGDAAPIFILGMPRAGSTLIEQILASHSQVEGTAELPDLGRIIEELSARAGMYPGCVAGLDNGQLAALGARYIERTRIYRKTDRPFFIDKTPSNWLHAGLIHLILPNAKIIDARRAPMATCFSVFKQLFGHGAAYASDLGDLGRYYNDYTGLMTHFDAVLPGRIYRVDYERVVADTEGEIRGLLAYCGLDMEPACLRFWETERAVATPSSEQVRQPIFRDAVEHWRRYEAFLGPLRAALA